MRYWTSFQEKWGFSEGESVPPDAWALRYVYVREINRLAAKLGSKVRLIAYDRGGFHNSLLIRRIDAKAVRKAQELDLCKGACNGGFEPRVSDWEDPESDEAMENAIDHFLCGDNEDLDELVEVDVSIKDEPDTVIHLSA
jgi:hypothetical protein